jgi:hypothetical protein
MPSGDEKCSTRFVLVPFRSTVIAVTPRFSLRTMAGQVREFFIVPGTYSDTGSARRAWKHGL